MVTMYIYPQSERKIESYRFTTIDNLPLTLREGKGLSIPLPPEDHPRLFFRKADITALKAKTNHPLLQNCWDKVFENASLTTDGKLVTKNVKHNVDRKVLDAIEAKAFLYALNGDEVKGNDAVDCIFNLHNTLIIDHKIPDVCREIGRVILTTSLVYDWCYDLINENEKNYLIDIMESLATEMEIKWPYLIQTSVGGHGVEAQVARDMLCCGIAVYNEKPDIYMRAAGRIFAEFIPAQNFNYRSGHHHQGSAYGPYRFIWEMYTTFVFDRMGYPNITHQLQGKMPYYWLYARRPDGQLIRSGNNFTDTYLTFGEYWTFPVILRAASYYKDPYLMAEAVKENLIGEDPLFDLLLVDPHVSVSSVESLPLTKYFPSPYGGMIARTDWKEGMDANTVVAEMKVAEYNFVGHQHFDAGNFQIYFKGPLAVQSGIYQGTEGGWGCNHFKNYYIRTIAHNCMLVYNPDEETVWQGSNVSNDGGQRFPAGGSEMTTIDEIEKYKTGKVCAHGFGPDVLKPEYSYLKGDITEAYSSKVKSYKRSFVFLNLNDSSVPAALIVYDHITSSDKNFKKTWLLHSVQEPVFKGNTFEVVRNEKGYNGKLLNTTLLPTSNNLVMSKVGGKENAYSVNGVNYPQYYIYENSAGDGAVWRTEISPKNPSETDLFLNVMQVMDADANTRPLEVEKIETDGFIGTKLGDRIVLFSKKSKEENQAMKLKVEGKGNFKVLITDLEEGEWEVLSANRKININFKDNHLYFEAVPGTYQIVKK